MDAARGAQAHSPRTPRAEREERKPQRAAEERLRIQRERQQQFPELSRGRVDAAQPEREAKETIPHATITSALATTASATAGAVRQDT